MAHYFMMDHYSRMTEELGSLSEDDLLAVNYQLIQVLEMLADGKMTRVQVENAIAQEDLSLEDPTPSNVFLSDPSGLSVKIINDTLYIGTNGDWINFSQVYDFLEIDWKSYFE